MAAYSQKDIDRITRATDLKPDQARILLEHYGGRPDVALERAFGVERIITQPESVEDVASPFSRLKAQWDGIVEAVRRIFPLAVPAAIMGLVGFALRLFTSGAFARGQA